MNLGFTVQRRVFRTMGGDGRAINRDAILSARRRLAAIDARLEYAETAEELEAAINGLEKVAGMLLIRGWE